MRKFARAGVVLAGLWVIGMATGVRADDGDRHCPDNPKATHRFFTSGSPDRDRTRLEALGAQVAGRPTPVCILAFIDREDPAYSKKLAIRRAVWVRDTLTGQGVSRDTIAVELRLSRPDQDKHAAREVDVILGP